jgi:hypothetical protein
MFQGGSDLSQLVTKTGAYELMEVMFSRLDSDQVKCMNSPINRIYAKGDVKTGKEMCTAFAK